MVPTMVGHEAAEDVSSSRKRYLQAYRFMLLARVLDDKLASLYRAGKIFGGVFLGRGQEAVSASLGVSLRKGDVFAPLIRDAAGRLAFGESILDALRTYLGSVKGTMRGRDGNVHRGKPLEGLLPMISHLGAMISVVNGVLMGQRFQNITGTVGAACIGEGATSTGAFHEALNQAAIEKLPLILIVANNQYAYSTPSARQFACRNLVDRAIGYGVEGHALDGTDLTNCLRVISAAIEKARHGGGPQLIVARLLRLCGHGEHDPADYVDPALKNSEVGRDCCKVAEEQILKNSFATRQELDAWQAEAVKEVEAAVNKVQREPAPAPYEIEWRALASKHLTETHPTE
jgi:pyruvate dehydrogenase E1 component alpha subunit/2-oxoisovalerate dehydrogenase E1 component alpha subunit